MLARPAALPIPLRSGRCGTSASVAFLGERLSLESLAQFQLIIAGLVIAAWAVKRKAQTDGRMSERNSRKRRFFPIDRV